MQLGHAESHRVGQNYIYLPNQVNQVCALQGRHDTVWNFRPLLLNPCTTQTHSVASFAMTLCSQRSRTSISLYIQMMMGMTTARGSLLNCLPEAFNIMRFPLHEQPSLLMSTYRSRHQELHGCPLFHWPLGSLGEGLSGNIYWSIFEACVQPMRRIFLWFLCPFWAPVFFYEDLFVSCPPCLCTIEKD